MSSQTSTKKRCALSECERDRVAVELLKRSVEGVPRAGAIKEVATKFGVDRKTVSRLWKHAEEEQDKSDMIRSPSQRNQRGCPKKDLTAKLDRLCSAPLAQRSTLRSHRRCLVWNEPNVIDVYKETGF
ncbi:hypothetical protein PPTG_24267 [Phytophthora nicotianae INRA-310]|uniref:DUF7769 domain-containing protein n=1 Tax=Phytophthora nicotianae (strain INRA-310) TaxID=761204 RepID=W2PK62_PHYN3|nr:hypothetical protein PPTG_24267 [Phytophthora nicotianae INRA-310]ETN00425.1 hypothetical protein PPTG_24267 [Phytophthora nicotianae INRA-310]